VSKIFLKRFYLFILREREREHMSGGRGRRRGRGREADSPLSRETHTGLDLTDPEITT